MQFSITTEVDAPPEVVFAVLSDVERWPEWTPTVTRVERLGDAGAPLALGGRLRIVQPKVPPAEWTVTALEPGRGFRLVSRSPGATVEADHWAEPMGAEHRSRVTLSVTFTGFPGRVIGWMMRGLNKRYLAQEAAGLKRRSEERARGTPAKGASRVTSFAPQFLVDDLSRAIAYYERLGFVFGDPWEGFYAIGVRDGLELHLKEAQKNATERSHRREHEHVDAAAGVDGIEAFYAHCRARGVSILKPLAATPWGTQQFYVEDPDGNIISFGGRAADQPER